MFYALAKDQDYFADKIHRFVAVSPCIISKQYSTWEEDVARMLKFRELGVYNIDGNDESSSNNDNMCGVIDAYCLPDWRSPQ